MVWRTARSTRWRGWPVVHPYQRERIRQIEARALRKLRQPARSRKLQSFLETPCTNDAGICDRWEVEDRGDGLCVPSVCPKYA